LGDGKKKRAREEEIYPPLEASEVAVEEKKTKGELKEVYKPQRGPIPEDEGEKS